MAEPASLPAPEDLRRWLAEDLGGGDLTSEALVPEGRRAACATVAKAGGVLSGADLLPALAAAAGFPLADVETAPDGARIKPGDVVARARGSARHLLALERTALNLVQRMSGIATLTAAFVEAVRGTGAGIYDTRKTLPGLRILEKRAVRAGGGRNHRFGLFDQFLVKNNHLACLPGPRPYARAVEAARKARPDVKLVIEVRDRPGFEEALAASPDVILLDNMDGLLMEELAGLRTERNPRVELEASGGIDLASVCAAAMSGVERISIGAITHSAPALDLALRIELA